MDKIYKSLLPSQNLRFKILESLSWIPDKWMLSIQYLIKLHRLINWKHPKRFTEKIQKYKTDYRNPLMHICVDKHNVRKYVESKGLSGILNKSLGVFKDADEINYDLLPDKFVIKTTNGGGGQNIVICKNKAELEYKETNTKLNNWLRLKAVDAGREWAYTGITEPKIIIEEFLTNEKNLDEGIEDYKILCFNGKPESIILDCDRYSSHKRNIYDPGWNRLDVVSDCPGKDTIIEKPDNLDEMLKIASILSEDFPFVRVDLYNISGKVIFGELTFYPWSGYVNFTPDSFDYELGKYFTYYQ